ncbi:MAG: geranylgeranyl reductase family protein [Nitrososphaeraceae archaeon]
MYDIAIVGGGPAGLSAAYSAAKEGSSVIVLERDKSIGHNIRTSGVSWIREMEKLSIPSKYYNPIKNYRFISPNNEVQINDNDSKSCVLDIRGLYQYLAHLATNNGAEISLNSTVTNASISVHENLCKLSVNTIRGQKNIECRLIIDASGFNSIVARKLGFAKNWNRYGIGAEYECYCDFVDSKTWTLMVGRQYSSAGYAWVFPLSNNRIRLGVGVGRPESEEDPINKLNFLIRNKLKPLNELGRIQPIEFHIGYIPNQGARSSVSDNLLLVGDSAGQSNPLVLEGIRHAIEFGRLAGLIGSESLNYNCTKKSLIRYEQEWKNKINSKINSALRVQKRWLNLTDKQWDTEIDILKSMNIDQFLDFVMADFDKKKIMRLAFNNPKIIAKQLFSLVLK